MNRWDKKKEKSKQIWMSVIIAGLMVFSVFGVLLSNQTSNELRYGKFKFTQVGNYYVTKISGKEIPFYTLPLEAETINISSIVTNTIKESYFVTLAFDPNSGAENLPVIELARFDLTQYLDGKIVSSAVTNLSSEYASLPLADCTNATLKTPVIIFNISNTAGVVDADSCIYLNGKGRDILRLRDRILYSYYGVIKDE
jgi:hypothetical protein